MATKYIIEQHTGYQFEPLPEGEFDTLDEALSGMDELEREMDWRNMRIVKETTEGNLVTSTGAVQYGLERNDDPENFAARYPDGQGLSES